MRACVDHDVSLLDTSLLINSRLSCPTCSLHPLSLHLRLAHWGTRSAASRGGGVGRVVMLGWKAASEFHRDRGFRGRAGNACPLRCDFMAPPLGSVRHLSASMTYGHVMVYNDYHRQRRLDSCQATLGDSTPSPRGMCICRRRVLTAEILPVDDPTRRSGSRQFP